MTRSKKENCLWGGEGAALFTPLPADVGPGKGKCNIVYNNDGEDAVKKASLSLCDVGKGGAVRVPKDYYDRMAPWEKPSFITKWEEFPREGANRV